MNREVVLSVCAVLVILIAAVAVALVVYNRRDLKRVVRILGVCVFFMLFAALYPYYMGDKLRKKHARIQTENTAQLEALTGRDFAKEDARAIVNLPAIISLANALYGKSYSVRERE